MLLLNLIFNLIRMGRQNPIAMMREGSAGEKEPKAKWLLALIGLVTLGGGYYIALRVTNSMEAFANYFLAVFLVVIGTYCLFTAGSITLLKILKKNKRYYYQTGHFITISGMLYRMKRNAVAACQHLHPLHHDPGDDLRHRVAVPGHRGRGGSPHPRRTGRALCAIFPPRAIRRILTS